MANPLKIPVISYQSPKSTAFVLALKGIAKFPSWLAYSTLMLYLVADATVPAIAVLRHWPSHPMMHPEGAIRFAEAAAMGCIASVTYSTNALQGLTDLYLTPAANTATHV